MKYLALLLITVALASAVQNNREENYITRFKEGWKYQYQYEGIVKNGLPEITSESTGVKIVTGVHLTFINNQMVLMELVEPKLYELNGTWELIEEESSQQKLSTLNIKFAEEMSRNTIKFHYTSGQVEFVFASEDEPEWVLRIKKGILNLFNLQMLNDESLPTFTRMEKSVMGECETMYDIREEYNTQLEVRTMNVTKVRDFDRCLSRPKSFTNMFMTKSCDNCNDQMYGQQELPFLRSMCTFRYNVTGSRLNFLIESAEAEGQHVFTPHAQDAGSAITAIRQRLQLTKVKPNEEILSIPRMVERGNLMPESPTWRNTRQEKNNKYNDMISVEQRIRHFLDLLTQNNEELLEEKMMEMNPEAPGHFILLVEAMREADYTTLKTIFSVFKTERSFRRDLFLDTLSTVGTFDSMRYIQELIEEEQSMETLGASTISRMLSSLAFIRNPTEPIVDRMMAICQESPLMMSNLLDMEMTSEMRTQVLRMRRSCWLSLGSMVYKLCSREDISYCPTKYDIAFKQCQKQYEGEELIPFMIYYNQIKNKPQILEQMDFSELSLKKMLMRETSLMCIKAIGNAGQSTRMETLRDIIQEANNINLMVDETVEIRVEAIQALRRMAREQPSKVITMLLPIFRDVQEDSEVRMSAYLMMMETNPSPMVMTMITKIMEREPSRQVKSLVYTHLTKLSTSVYPCYQNLTRGARLALRFMRQPFTRWLQYSSFTHLAQWFKDWRMGATFDMETLYTKASFMPRSTRAKLNVNVLGRNINVMEAGVRTEGLQNMYDKLFGPKGLWYKKDSLFNMFSRTPRSVDSNTITEQINNIKSKVGAIQRQFEEPLGMFWMRMFDEEISYNTLSMNEMQSLMTQGNFEMKESSENMWRVGRRFNFTKANMLMDSELMLPTMIGMPLSLNITAAMMTTLMNTRVGAKVDPSIFSTKPENIEIEFSVKPTLAISVIGRMGVDMTLIRTGVAINSSLTGQVNETGKLELKLRDQVFKLKNTVPETSQTFNFLSYNQTMYTFMNKIDRRTEMYTPLNFSFSGMQFTNETNCFWWNTNGIKTCYEQMMMRPWSTLQSTRFMRNTMQPMQYMQSMQYEESMQSVESMQMSSRMPTTGMPTRMPNMPYMPNMPTMSNMWSSNMMPRTWAMPLLRPYSFRMFNIRGINVPEEMEIKIEMRPHSNPLIQEVLFKYKTIGGEEPEENVLSFKLDQRTDNRQLQMNLFRTMWPEWKLESTLFVSKPNEEVRMMLGWGIKSTEENSRYPSEMEMTFQVPQISSQMPFRNQLIVNAKWYQSPAFNPQMNMMFQYMGSRIMEFLMVSMGAQNVNIMPLMKEDTQSLEMIFELLTPQEFAMLMRLPQSEIRAGIVRMPFGLRVPQTIPRHIPDSMQLMQERFTRTFMPMCMVNQTDIFTTFDNRTFRYEMPGSCPHVLVKDCSRNQLFTVLVQNMTRNTALPMDKTYKKVTAYVEKHRVEFTQTLDKELEVFVDGSRLSFTQEERMTVVVPYVGKFMYNKTEINMTTEIGLTLFYGRDYVYSQVSLSYYNKTCGLCGDFNGESYNDLRTPLDTPVMDENKFGLSWLVEGDDCTDPECKLMKNRVFRLDERVMINGVEKTCFSVEPVMTCPKSCEPIEMSEQTFYGAVRQWRQIPQIKTQVKFHCIESTNEDAILRKFDKAEGTYVLHSKTVDFTTEIETPRDCQCSSDCVNWEPKKV